MKPLTNAAPAHLTPREGFGQGRGPEQREPLAVYEGEVVVHAQTETVRLDDGGDGEWLETWLTHRLREAGALRLGGASARVRITVEAGE